MLSMERRYVRRLFRSVLGENAVTAVPPERRLPCSTLQVSPSYIMESLENPPDTEPAVEGHKGHNHVPPPRLGVAGDEIVFSTTTQRCFFSFRIRPFLVLYLIDVMCLDRLLSPKRFCWL